MSQKDRSTQRRTFLKTGAVAAAGIASGASVGSAAQNPMATPLPTIKLGEHEITRFISGWNPIGGHAHAVPALSLHMKEYFTDERVNEFLVNVENAGINCWQFSHGAKSIAACRHLRERGSKLKTMVLHAERTLDDPIAKVVEDTGCWSVVHHGNVTDMLIRAGRAQQVHDYVKKAHDLGIMAGISAHNPDNIKMIADEGWENDFFMTCFYYVTRPSDEQQEQMGKVVLGEPFLLSDPTDMTDVVKQIDTPCLAFKILGAGRNCTSDYAVEKAFRFAFENIKPTDAVVVGMYPRFRDEISHNVALTMKYA
jgi:hypothetical protein